MLARLRHRLDRPAIDRDVGQDRCAREVPVPDVVVDELVVPQPLTGLEIHRDEAVGEQVVAVTMPTVIVVGRHLGGEVGDAELLVDAHLTPGSCVTRVSPRLVEPGVVAELVGSGNRVKDPPAFAGTCVESANVALDVLHGPRRAAREMCGADQECVTGDDGRGVQADLACDQIDVLIHVLLEVDDPVGAEAGDPLPGCGVERDELIPRGDVEDLPRTPIVSVCKTAARESTWRRRTTLPFV